MAVVAALAAASIARRAAFLSIGTGRNSALLTHARMHKIMITFRYLANNCKDFRTSCTTYAIRFVLFTVLRMSLGVTP